MAFNRGFYCSKLIGMLFKPTLISTELNRFKVMSLLNLNKLGTVMGAMPDLGHGSI